MINSLSQKLGCLGPWIARNHEVVGGGRELMIGYLGLSTY